MDSLTTEAPVKDAVLLHTRPVIDFDRNQFYEFCQINRGQRIERTADGDIIIMAPTGGSTGSGNFELAMAFADAVEARKTGRFFDSSSGFDLPNGATRSPDVSWVSAARLDALSDADWEKFLPLCPDFVVELRSKSDKLSALEAKMEEYRENGARLGWLIDPDSKSVTVYRKDAGAEKLDDPDSVSGEDVLPGFTLELGPIWRAMRLP